LRDDDPLRLDPRHPGGHHRGRSPRRAVRCGDVPLHHGAEHPPRARRGPHDDRDGDPEGLRHRAHHDGRQLRHVRRRERVLHAKLPLQRQGHRRDARGDPLRARHPARRLQRAPDAQGGGDPMTTSTPAVVQAPARSAVPDRARKLRKRLSNPWASLAAIVIAVLWTVPTVGLLVTSFRPQSDITSSGWWTVFNFWDGRPTNFTFSNYEQALFGGQTSLATYFVNTIVVTLPSVVIPISIALLAAYAFAWIDFKGRDVLFVAVFALQIVPIQVTLIPLLTQYN